LELPRQRAALAREPREVTMRIEPERKGTDPGQVTLIEQEDECVAARLANDSTTHLVRGGERGKSHAVLSLAARPPRHLLHHSKTVEPVRPYPLRDRDPLGLSVRRHHSAVAREDHRGPRFHRPRRAADVVRDQLEAGNPSDGVQLRRVDTMHTAWCAEHVLAAELRGSAVILLERNRVVAEPH